VVSATAISTIFFLSYTFLYRISDVKSLFFPGQDPLLHALWGLQFYLFGTVLFRYKEIVLRYSHYIALLALLLLLLLLSILETVTPGFACLIQYSYLTFAFCFFVATTRKTNILSRTARHTMGVYLLHTPVLLKAVSSAVSFINIGQLLGYLLTLALTFFLSLLLARTISLTPYGKIVFGEAGRARDS
jgi:hypothetical protein